MADRKWGRAGASTGVASRGRWKPAVEAMESRHLLAASINTLAAVSSPANLGVQVPIDGSAAVSAQTFTVTSSNPDVVATVARGRFLTVGVTHDSSGGTDRGFAGTVMFQLFDDLTPITASMIENLVNTGFYTSPTTNGALPRKNFHRIINNFPGVNDFAIQGGSANGDGTGNPPGQFPFTDEFVQQLAFTGQGQLAMANTGRPDTNSSQFFVTTGTPRFADFRYTLFGQVVGGADTLANMANVAKQAQSTTNSEVSRPITPILFTSATLSDTSPNGVIHVDTTRATAGQTATLTVTATNPATGTSTTRTIPVTVTDNATTTEPVVLGALTTFPGGTVQNVGAGQTAVFRLPVVNANPGITPTFIVRGGTTTNTAGASVFTPVDATRATATVDSNGIVTVTPVNGFTGTIPLLVGVSSTPTAPNAAPSPANFYTHSVQVAVSGSAVTLPPIAIQGRTTVVANTATTAQLAANSANPATNPALTYSIVSGPSNGTVTNLNSSTGALTYTPAPGFTGTDALTFRVANAASPGLASTAVQTFVVNGGNTNAVRLIGNVLVVTPLPRTDKGTNTITVSQANGRVQVTVNGMIDQNAPNVANVDRIVVYGSKANDVIRVDPAVTIPATLDGGHGGTNTLRAGGGETRLHGWFGRNDLTGGAANDALIGRAGHVRFHRSGGNDILFQSTANPAHPRLPHTGTFSKFVGNRLVTTRNPYPRGTVTLSGPNTGSGGRTGRGTTGGTTSGGTTGGGTIGGGTTGGGTIGGGTTGGGTIGGGTIGGGTTGGGTTGGGTIGGGTTGGPLGGGTIGGTTGGGTIGGGTIGGTPGGGTTTGVPITGGPITGGPITGGPSTGGPITGGPTTGGPSTGGTTGGTTGIVTNRSV